MKTSKEVGDRTLRLWAVKSLLLIAFSWSQPGSAAPVTLYANPAYQSPVRGEPDDLLLLAGYGFSADDMVVYSAISDTTKSLTPPKIMPTESTEVEGVATLVSSSNIPYSLTIKLPTAIRGGQSYALWVRNHSGEWSSGFRINDARPLWITPSYVYASTKVADLERTVKIVGRNLRSAGSARTMVKFVGPQTIVLPSVPDEAPGSSVDDYVARVGLPARMMPGPYTIKLSRDGVSWITLPGQALNVLPDPAPARVFLITTEAYGGCHADDGLDDTRCILDAIKAANAAGGGEVVLPMGEWELSSSDVRGLDGGNGISVPIGVSLKGAGSNTTFLIRHVGWGGTEPRSLLTLDGRNTVQGLTFRDLNMYAAKDFGRGSPTLQLGRPFHQLKSDDARPRSVDDVVITGNVFDKSHPAVITGGLPIARLFITANVFGAWERGLSLSGNRYNTIYPYRIDDSVITGNMFKPGSYLDASIDQGVIASEIGAAHRLDFSNNTADGASAEYLYSPDDARGWRAGFFWNMNGNLEMMLVSNNIANCTGDKVGDGEAISYDANTDAFAFGAARPVIAATASSVTVEGTMKSRHNERDVSVADYYVGHWLQIGEGRGVGQSRKIVSYRVDAKKAQVTFEVAPAFDVAPVAGSRISVGRQYWQVYTLANEIDQRKPLCQKSNRTHARAGGINLWAQFADSVVEGNRQYDSDGINLHQSYSAEDSAQCPGWGCGYGASYQSFVEVRNNLIDGEYDWNSDCSWSGITVGTSASPSPSSPPPTVGYGLSISHNTITRADSFRGGAIATPLTWHNGPAPYRWPIVNNLLIHHNLIKDLSGPMARACGGASNTPRVGINLSQAGNTVWRTVLYANTCSNVATGFLDGGNGTARICAGVDRGSCECR